MKTKLAFVLLGLWSIPFLSAAQVTSANQDKGQQIPLGPEPEIILIGAKATPSGVELEIQAKNLGTMGIWFEKRNKTTGEWSHLINGLDFPVPPELRDTSQEVGTTFVVPYLLPDKNNPYRAGLYGKAKADDPRDWKYSNLREFEGFDNTPKPIANSIELQFSDSLSSPTKTETRYPYN